MNITSFMLPDLSSAGKTIGRTAPGDIPLRPRGAVLLGLGLGAATSDRESAPLDQPEAARRRWPRLPPPVFLPGNDSVRFLVPGQKLADTFWIGRSWIVARLRHMQRRCLGGIQTISRSIRDQFGERIFAVVSLDPPGWHALFEGRLQNESWQIRYDGSLWPHWCGQGFPFDISHVRLHVATAK